ncbi:MAG: UrcA family protein [Allosphingosinicella sp.]
MKTLTLAVLAASLFVVPANAQYLAPASATQIVEYADLDLGSDAGRAVLDRRIRAAVQTACGTSSSADPRSRESVRACRAETLSLAIAQRDRAIETALRSAPTVLAAQR